MAICFLTFLHNLNIGHLKFRITSEAEQGQRLDNNSVGDARMTLKRAVAVHLPLSMGGQVAVHLPFNTSKLPWVHPDRKFMTFRGHPPRVMRYPCVCRKRDNTKPPDCQGVCPLLLSYLFQTSPAKATLPCP